MLRTARRKPESGDLVSISGADPLNLIGILTPGPKLAALSGNRLLYRDGVPVGFLAGGEVEFTLEMDAASKWRARKVLLRGSTGMHSDVGANGPDNLSVAAQ
jgi:ATP-dependent Lhr-like helicase